MGVVCSLQILTQGCKLHCCKNLFIASLYKSLIRGVACPLQILTHGCGLLYCMYIYTLGCSLICCTWVL